MIASSVEKNQWQEICNIYIEAFPQKERKPFWVLQHSVKCGKVQIFVETVNNAVQGFIVVIPFKNMIMVDYLAVSAKTRSRGTGSRMLQDICQRFSEKKVVLLIERLEDEAENKEQRIARRKFYLKNGFTSSGIFIQGASGAMEVLNYGGMVTPEEYLSLQKYALGALFFRLSKIQLVN